MDASEQIDSLSNEVVKKCLYEYLSQRFPKQNHDYKLQKATEKGDNYIGEVYRITVKVHQSTKNCFSLILKVPPQNLIRRKQFFAGPCFQREALAYEEFLPLVMQFQSERGIAVNEGFFAVAKCYKIFTTELNEAIFLEDLSLRGYQMFNRLQLITVDYVSTIMRLYGKLHAVSFTIKDQCAEKLSKFQLMQDIFLMRREDNQLSGYFDGLKKSTLNTLNSVDDAKYKIKFENFLAKGNFFDIFLEYVIGTKCEPYAVVCHGDCWNNNILFKLEESKVTDACLIDWQIMRYASPVTDIMYYIFTSTTGEFRRHHYEDMMNVYYSSLSEHIKRLGSDPMKLFSRDAFNKELTKYGIFGLFMAMMVIPVITIKKEDVPDLQALSEQFEADRKVDFESLGFSGHSNSGAYNKRMRDVVVDCIEYGYL